MLKCFHSNLFYASDLNKTAQFYEQLGFSVSKDTEAVRVKLGDFALEFIDENRTIIKNESGAQPKGLGVFTYVEVDDVDAFYTLLKEKGVDISHEPKDWPWGKREFVVKDPDGYKVVFYVPNKE